MHIRSTLFLPGKMLRICMILCQKNGWEHLLRRCCAGKTTPKHHKVCLLHCSCNYFHARALRSFSVMYIHVHVILHLKHAYFWWVEPSFAYKGLKLARWFSHCLESQHQWCIKLPISWHRWICIWTTDKWRSVLCVHIYVCMKIHDCTWILINPWHT